MTQRAARPAGRGPRATHRGLRGRLVGIASTGESTNIAFSTTIYIYIYIYAAGSSEEQLFETLDLAFTLVFAAELLANMFINWFW